VLAQANLLFLVERLMLRATVRRPHVLAQAELAKPGYPCHLHLSPGRGDTSLSTYKLTTLYPKLSPRAKLHTCLKPYKSDERVMAIEHFEALRSSNIDLKRFLVIFDRGYPSLSLIYYLVRNEINFLIRCGTGFIKEVNEILKSNKRDEIIKITPQRLKQIHKSKKEIARLFPGKCAYSWLQD